MSNAYLTIAEFQARFDHRTIFQLSNDANQRVAVEEVIQTIVDDAASELDAALNGRYTLPLTTIPSILKRYVAIRAMGLMWMRRGGADKPKGMESQFKWADEFIEKIMDGSMVIPSNTPAALPTLDSSEYTDGRSRFDNVRNFDVRPSETSTSRGE